MEHKCPTSRPRECPTLANLLFLLAVQAGVAPRRGLAANSHSNDLIESGTQNHSTHFQGFPYAWVPLFEAHTEVIP